MHMQQHKLKIAYAYATAQNSLHVTWTEEAPDAAATIIYLEAASRVIALTARLICQTPPQDCWIIPVIETICHKCAVCLQHTPLLSSQ